MRQLLILTGMLFFLASCTETKITVRSNQTPNRPYTKILAVYLEQGCDFSIFDSTAYNICLKSSFLNADGTEVRQRVEGRIKKKLTTSGTRVLCSSDLFDNDRNSYLFFRRTIDSLGIDAVLLVGLRSYSHDEQTTPVSTTPDYRNPGLPVNPLYTRGRYDELGQFRQDPYTTLNAHFVCDLVNTKAIFIPVWRAEILEKGKRETGANGLNKKMTQKLAETLKGSHYIAH